MVVTVRTDSSGAEWLLIDGREVCSVVLDGDGLKWVSVKRVCVELELQHIGQVQRIRGCSWARHCLLRIKATDHKTYKTFCIALEDVGMWLSTLTKSRLKGSPTAAYFIRSRLTGYIKIGTSIDAEKRLKGLARQYPDCFELLAVGGIEAELHESLSQHRVHGEWFRPHADVLKELQKAGGNLDRPVVVAGLKKRSDGPDDFSWLEGMKFEIDD